MAAEFAALARECRYIETYLCNKLRFAQAFPKPATPLPSSVVKPRECSVLLLAANPDSSDRLALDEEVRGIKKKLRASEHRDRISLRNHWATQPDDLLQAMNETRPTVVHFSGHGSVRGILLHDGQGGGKLARATALKRLFQSSKEPVRVVVLSSCYSARQVAALIEVVDCVVGMKGAVDDETARTFSAAFYSALGFGHDVKKAFDQGTTAISLKSLPGETVPILQTRAGIDAATIVLVSD